MVDQPLIIQLHKMGNQTTLALEVGMQQSTTWAKSPLRSLNQSMQHRLTAHIQHHINRLNDRIIPLVVMTVLHLEISLVIQCSTEANNAMEYDAKLKVHYPL